MARLLLVISLNLILYFSIPSFAQISCNDLFTTNSGTLTLPVFRVSDIRFAYLFQSPEVTFWRLLQLASLNTIVQNLPSSINPLRMNFSPEFRDDLNTILKPYGLEITTQQIEAHFLTGRQMLILFQHPEIWQKYTLKDDQIPRLRKVGSKTLEDQNHVDMNELAPHKVSPYMRAAFIFAQHRINSELQAAWETPQYPNRIHSIRKIPIVLTLPWLLSAFYTLNLPTDRLVSDSWVLLSLEEWVQLSQLESYENAFESLLVMDIRNKTWRGVEVIRHSALSNPESRIESYRMNKDVRGYLVTAEAKEQIVTMKATFSPVTGESQYTEQLEDLGLNVIDIRTEVKADPSLSRVHAVISGPAIMLLDLEWFDGLIGLER